MAAILTLHRRWGEIVRRTATACKQWCGQCHIRRAVASGAFLGTYAFLITEKIESLVDKLSNGGTLTAELMVLMAIALAMILEGRHVCSTVRYILQTCREVIATIETLAERLGRIFDRLTKAIFGEPEEK